MSIRLYLRKKEYEIEKPMTVRQALDKIGLSPESHLVLRNGELLTDKDLLKDGDEVKLIAVISGG